MDEKVSNQTQPTTDRAWLQALMLRDPGRWSSRLGALLSWMKMIGRGQRRRFGRAAAGVLAGASGIALMAMLAGPMAPPVHAATINVDGTCTLIDAIKAANTDAVAGECVAGSGADVITLSLDRAYTAAYSSGNALPIITSDITIRADTGTRTITLDNSSNSFRVVEVSGATAKLTLENINMSGGKVEAGSGAQIYVGDGASLSISGGTFSNGFGLVGGSVYAKNGTVTIEDAATFSNNQAGYSGASSTVFAKGGAIAVTGSTLTITGSFVNDNKIGINYGLKASYGGGVFASNSDVTITSSEVNRNKMENRNYTSGTGIAITDGSTLIINDSSVSGNGNTHPVPIGGPGGGIYIKMSEATLSGTTVSDNTAQRRGGGIYSIDSTLTVTNSSTISNNLTLADNATGGGIFSSDSVVTVSNSVVNNNKGTGGNVRGGGMYVGGDDYPERTLTIDNTVISGNYSDIGGGGVYVTYVNEVSITNSTVSYNDGNQSGGGIYLSYIMDGVISNTVVQGNQAPSGFGGGVLVSYANVQIVDSLIADNYSYYLGGGVSIYYDSTLVISGTTITGNRTDSAGGGLGVYYGSYTGNDYEFSVTIRNSTISDNTANHYGGGIFVSSYANADDPLTLIHTTVTDNYVGDYGGGIYMASGTMTITASIVSGNSAAISGHEIDQYGESTINVYDSVVGESTYDDANAFYGSVNFGSGTIRATSDGDQPTALADIIDTTLADNGGKGTLPGGGNTPTHALADGSPALDIILGATCDVAIDQRGEPRPSGDGCDAGAVEYQTDDVSGEAMTFISTWTGGTVGGLSFGPHDVLGWDGDGWTKWFTGADAGLDPLGKWKHNLNAIWISDTEGADIIFSLTQDNRVVPGIRGIVDGMDLLHWDGDALSLYFDGQDVGLNVKTQEKIDGLHILPEAPEWSEFSGDSCDAYLLISVQGAGIVPKPGMKNNVLKFSGEDVLGFCATNLGQNTTGFWEMAMDGSVEGLKKNNLDSLAANTDASVLYLTTKQQINLDDAFGGHSMVFAFDMETRRFSGPYVRVMDDLGIQPKVDALHVTGELTLP